MIGDVIAERYELLEICGTGGMSTVYKAHDQLLERNVALKVLHPHYGDDDEYVVKALEWICDCAKKVGGPDAVAIAPPSLGAPSC